MDMTGEQKGKATQFLHDYTVILADTRVLLAYCQIHTCLRHVVLPVKTRTARFSLQQTSLHVSSF